MYSMAEQPFGTRAGGVPTGSFPDPQLCLTSSGEPAGAFCGGYSFSPESGLELGSSHFLNYLLGLQKTEGLLSSTKHGAYQICTVALPLQPIPLHG